MHWTDKMIQYLFFFMHTVQPTVDIDEEIDSLSYFSYSFDDLDFEYWLKDNSLEEEYKEFRDRA